ncbi:hypothetical protein LTR78_003313 [Recurvomyces mirabilis]|uniref:Uncharacterized protein n=1 Tax=Recurvomyces mirabilis TaxID=574656 RepID=A0AAE0WSN5_9PEZI|nr:hypothetical protein LTR78_003313 [Recurvomyces mirabilis]KAK5156870.1 hypothetical protein LTS14_004387 [Recurvomyces mirabilis]
MDAWLLVDSASGNAIEGDKDVFVEDSAPGALRAEEADDYARNAMRGVDQRVERDKVKLAKAGDAVLSSLANLESFAEPPHSRSQQELLRRTWLRALDYLESIGTKIESAPHGYHKAARAESPLLVRSDAPMPVMLQRKFHGGAFDTTTKQDDATLLAEYIMRAGDASIAQERLDEWDQEALFPASTHRRASLVQDLMEASYDADILAAQCTARGLDPMTARIRRMSIT